MSDTVLVSIRIPADLHQQIVREAETRGESFSNAARRRLGGDPQEVDWEERLSAVEADVAELKEMARGF